MNKLRGNDVELLTRLFSDSAVVDVDMARWDDGIGLLLIADHFERWTNRAPVVYVFFEDVYSISMTFDHHEVRNEVRRGRADGHLRWWIDDFEVERRSEGWKISLSGQPPRDPLMVIEFGRAHWEKVDVAQLDARYPGWSNPFGPLVRKSPLSKA